MKRSIAFLLFLFTPYLYSQKMDIYVPVPSKEIRVEASSEFKGFDAEESINGSGMKYHSHISQNLGKTMWLSKISEAPVKARPQTKEGVVWLLYEFKTARELDLIEIWNHNQDNHTNRGLQKVYLEYSEDGEDWHLLKDGDNDYFVIPESGGRKLEPANLKLELDGLNIKYLTITADLEKGNHYRDGSKRTIEEAGWTNQNINYYGLSEIRFYQKKEKRISEVNEIGEVVFSATPGYRKSRKGPSREFLVEFDNPLFFGGKLEVEVNNKTEVASIPPSAKGIYRFTSTLPSGIMREAAEVKLSFESSQGGLQKKLEVEGAREWVVYFLPHSHLDIGYTHEHEEVMKLQLRNLDIAMELAEKTKNYPLGSRFKWNVEVMWPIEEYLKQNNGTRQGELFVEAVKNGTIGLNASLGSILTGISKQEELTHMFDDAHRVGNKLGVDIESVMMSDIPGMSWGTVTAMAENGIKYFSMAPNYVPHLLTGGSRVGQSHIEWGDYPFYWQSQSGEEKVLAWSAGKGYSFFHDWLGGRISSSGPIPVWEYLSDLEKKEFPFNMAYFRYTINGDNGPPDTQMPNVIREWNETYEYPKFIIGTTDELFQEFEKKYKDHLPEFKGDFTPYWEDGAASTAAELAMNRKNAERLNQLEVLWSIVGASKKEHFFPLMVPEDSFLAEGPSGASSGSLSKDVENFKLVDHYPAKDFQTAWRNIVLFSEHTWGASASRSSPESEFTQTLWKQKQAFALTADAATENIHEKLVSSINGTDKPKQIQVFNTNLWPRTDVVTINTSIDLSSSFLVDQEGEMVQLQKTGDGRWIFIAEEVAPMSSKVYTISSSKTSKVSDELEITGNTISNGILTVTLDSLNGAISSLVDNRTGKEFSGGNGLNEFIYTGRNAASPEYLETIEGIEILNEGPVAVTLRSVSSAPGTRSLLRDVTLYEGIPRVDIINRVDKTKNYDYENLRFAFPFNIPNSETIIDLAFSEMIPERDQLSGANKNFFSVNNGVTVSGLKNSVMLTTITTPIVELGEMTGEEWMTDNREFLAWKRSTSSSSTIFSWAMNNSWGTNYRASQEGLAVFEYSIIPLEAYSHLSKTKGMEIAQPLIGLVSDNPKAYEQLFRLTGRHKIAVSTIRPAKDNSGYILRLVNLSNQSVQTSFDWGELLPEEIYECDDQGKFIREIKGKTFWMKPYGTLTVKLNL